MQNIILILQIVISLTFSVLVLIQPRGSGLGRAFGGGGVSFTRRGFEKALFRFTFVAGALFVIVSFIGLLL